MSEARDSAVGAHRHCGSIGRDVGNELLALCTLEHISELACPRCHSEILDTSLYQRDAEVP
jgi:hypothetical protein